MKLFQLMMLTKPEFDNTIKIILQRKEYKQLRNPIEDFLGNIRDAFKQWIIRILKGRFSNLKAVSVSDKLADVFMIIGILIVLVVVTLIILKITKSSKKNNRIKEILGERIDGRTTPASLRDKAADNEKQEEFRLAVRFDFIAVLLLMHQTGLLILDETQTNEEMYNYLGIKQFRYLQNFKKVIEKFNYIWYGNKETGRVLFDEWRQDFDSLWNGVIKYEEQK